MVSPKDYTANIGLLFKSNRLLEEYSTDVLFN